MSGPYALAAFVDAVFSGEVDGGATVSSALLFTAYQKAYGNIYADPAEVFSTPYAAGIESLLPSTTPRSQLYAAGLLPQYALFSSTPPAPQFAPSHRRPTPADLAEVFALGFGTGNLIQNSYRLSYLLDAQANPDGGWPTLTTGVAGRGAGVEHASGIEGERSARLGADGPRAAVRRRRGPRGVSGSTPG